MIGQNMRHRIDEHLLPGLWVSVCEKCLACTFAGSFTHSWTVLNLRVSVVL